MEVLRRLGRISGVEVLARGRRLGRILGVGVRNFWLG